MCQCNWLDYDGWQIGPMCQCKWISLHLYDRQAQNISLSPSLPHAYVDQDQSDNHYAAYHDMGSHGCSYNYIQNILINIIAMHINTQDLLAFCAYYNITKAAARLPLNPLPHPKQHSTQQNKEAKATRKKMEVVQPRKSQKIVKPKIEQVPRRSEKRSVSPIDRINSMKQAAEANNKQYDLDYFMSHMTDRHYTPNYNQVPRQHNHNNPYSKSTQNYDTFGRNGAYQKQYQTYEEKVRRQNNKYTTSAVNRYNNQPKQTYANKFTATQYNNNCSYNWPYNQTAKKTFINTTHTAQSKIPFVSQYSPLHQNNQIKMTYSPSARNHSPTPSSLLSNSWIKGSPVAQSNLSKSRSKHQRKKSERPFYDASKLTLKADEPQRQNREEQSLLSQSFVSMHQNGMATSNNNRKQMGEQNKRQTSTTAPPRIYNKMQSRNQRQQQVDLDDDLGQTLSELQRHPPIALEVKIKPIK